jgi:LmbE family N-acetylglucosaminyl deacetylase
MAKSYQHVYLSPHYDDASLSCGGAIHQQTQAGQSVLVVTICAAPPAQGEPFSAFAESLHQRWGNPENVVATRQAEDRASMNILGADYRWFDFTDCIYRGNPKKQEWYYNSDAELFGQVQPADVMLADEIAEVITQQVPRGEDTMIYAPLSAGYHVDHQLTHAAAWKLRQQEDWTVIFYEDYPYSDPDYAPHGLENPADLESTLTRLQELNLRPQLRLLSEENLQAKIDSIAAYASQMAILFGTRAKMEGQVRKYALRVGEGKPAERIWIPAG